MDNTADIHIKNIPISVLNGIDYKVNELNKNTEGKKWNRTSYIKMVLADDAKRELIDYEKTKFELLLKKNNDLQIENLRGLNRILYLITTGDIPQGLNLLDELSSEEGE